MQVLKRHPETICIVGSALFNLATRICLFHSPPVGWHGWDVIMELKVINTLALTWYLANNSLVQLISGIWFVVYNEE
jgi:hypothetical protein